MSRRALPDPHASTTGSTWPAAWQGIPSQQPVPRRSPLDSPAVAGERRRIRCWVRVGGRRAVFLRGLRVRGRIGTCPDSGCCAPRAPGKRLTRAIFPPPGARPSTARSRRTRGGGEEEEEDWVAAAGGGVPSVSAPALSSTRMTVRSVLTTAVVSPINAVALGIPAQAPRLVPLSLQATHGASPEPGRARSRTPCRRRR